MSVPSSDQSRPEHLVLLVDDDTAMRASCGSVLRGAGYAVEEAADGEEALAKADRLKPALILLDVEMPRRNGWQTLLALRERNHTEPVLMLTGATAIDDKVRGLAAGADDYIGKPCDPRELLARVHAIIRRSRPAAPTLPVLRFDDTQVDLARRTAVRAGKPLTFTRTEYAMLELFARQPGLPLSREFLLEKVWGYTNELNTRTVETHVWRLRQKIGDRAGDPKWIRTVPGVGYALELTQGAPAEPSR